MVRTERVKSHLSEPEKTVRKEKEKDRENQDGEDSQILSVLSMTKTIDYTLNIRTKTTSQGVKNMLINF